MIPSFSIDLHSEVELHEQIAQRIEALIASGRLAPGDSLPSSRQLAEALSVARGTVVRAYKNLTDRRLIETRKGQGTRVTNKSAGIVAASGTVKRLPEPTDSKESEAVRCSEFSRRLMSFELDGALYADMSRAAPPRELLPIRQWRAAIQQRMQHWQLMPRDGDEFGDPDLRAAVCKFLSKTRGVDCTPENICMFDESQHAHRALAQMLIDSGDVVVVENPGYQGARELFYANGADVVAMPVDDHGMLVNRLNSLTASAKFAYVSPSAHDPLGVVMSEQRQRELIQWARRNDSWIVEDGWDTDFWFGRSPSVCLQQKDPERVFYLYTFWKLLFPLATLSFLVVPPRMVPILRCMRRAVERPWEGVEARVLCDLLSDGTIDRLLVRASKSYRQRRQALIYALKTAFREAITIHPSTSGSHIRVSFDKAISEQTAYEAASRSGLKIVSLQYYYVDPPAQAQFLMPFFQIDADTVQAPVKTFKRHLQYGS